MEYIILNITTAALNRFVESVELSELSQQANELIQALAEGFLSPGKWPELFMRFEKKIDMTNFSS